MRKPNDRRTQSFAVGECKRSACANVDCWRSPKVSTLRQSTEFASRALLHCAVQTQFEMAWNDSGEPCRTGFCECSNEVPSIKCMRIESIVGRAETRAIIELRLKHFDRARPRSRIGQHRRGRSLGICNRRAGLSAVSKHDWALRDPPGRCLASRR